MDDLVNKVPLVFVMIKLGLGFGASSMNVERYYSVKRIIKNHLRNSLLVDTLNQLMNISINGQNLEDLNNEDLEEILKIYDVLV